MATLFLFLFIIQSGCRQYACYSYLSNIPKKFTILFWHLNVVGFPFCSSYHVWVPEGLFIFQNVTFWQRQCSVCTMFLLWSNKSEVPISYRIIRTVFQQMVSLLHHNVFKKCWYMMACMPHHRLLYYLVRTIGLVDFSCHILRISREREMNLH